jgi:hypothetical protein
LFLHHTAKEQRVIRAKLPCEGLDYEVNGFKKEGAIKEKKKYQKEAVWYK